MTGILIVNKPEGWTSHDVVAKLRGVFKEKRIGHAGTLDPMATGVLPIFLGRATRVVEFATEGQKRYIAGIHLGQTSDTQDSTGTILSQSTTSITNEQLQQALMPFRGEIQQIPPMYSAIKIQGKKLYELARKGKEVERPSRRITISDLEILPETNGHGDPLLYIECSKGTYVRTICHDIGANLGCGAVMSSLVRTSAAGFTLEQSYALDDIINHTSPASLLLPIDAYFNHDKIRVLPWQETKIRNGADFNLETAQHRMDGTYSLYNDKDEFLSISSVNCNKVHTIKSFYEVVSE